MILIICQGLHGSEGPKLHLWSAFCVEIHLELPKGWSRGLGYVDINIINFLSDSFKLYTL